METPLCLLQAWKHLSVDAPLAFCIKHVCHWWCWHRWLLKTLSSAGHFGFSARHLKNHAQRSSVVHNAGPHVLYHWSGAQRRFHKPISLLTDRQTPTEPVWLLRLLPWERKMLHQFTLAERDWFPLKGGAFWVPVLLSYLLSLLKWGYATLQEKWGEGKYVSVPSRVKRGGGDSVHQVCASYKNFDNSIRPGYQN